MDEHLYCQFLNNLINKEDEPKGYVGKNEIFQIIKNEIKIIKKRYNGHNNILLHFKIFSDLENKGLIEKKEILMFPTNSFSNFYCFNDNAIKNEIRKVKLKMII